MTIRVRLRSPPCPETQPILHRAVVCASADLADRVSILASKPHMAVYRSIKPLDKRTFSSYLLQHSLGQWVKLRLRSASLQLLSFLVTRIRPPLADSELACRLCGDGVEDVAHFLCTCVALVPERLALITSLSHDVQLQALPAARSFISLISRWQPSQCIPALLESCEDPCDAKLAISSPRSVMISAAEPHIPKFLAAIWLRRSEILMGRIPSLGVHGDRLATSSLLFDGRARSFAVGPRFESLNITSFGRLPLC